MQTISVGGLVNNSSVFASVIFPGASATLPDGILTLDSIKGEDGQDGTDATETAGSGGTPVASGVSLIPIIALTWGDISWDHDYLPPIPANCSEIR